MPTEALLRLFSLLAISSAAAPCKSRRLNGPFYHILDLKLFLSSKTFLKTWR